MRLRKQRKTIVAIPADTHNASTVGLMSDKEWVLSDGNRISRNKFQDKLSEHWDNSWLGVKEARKGGAKVIVAVAGDAIEGLHHSELQVMTNIIKEQELMHISSMERAFNIIDFRPDKGDELYYIEGNDAHAGRGGSSEENIARDLGAIPCVPPKTEDEDEEKKGSGKYLWQRLRRKTNGVLFDIAHYGPTAGSRMWLTGNVMQLVVTSFYYECLENQIEIPRYYLRAHRHSWIPPRRHSGEHGTIEGFLIPPFQVPTIYGRMYFYRMVQNIGLLFFVVDEDGSSRWECDRLKVQMDDIIED